MRLALKIVVLTSSVLAVVACDRTPEPTSATREPAAAAATGTSKPTTHPPSPTRLAGDGGANAPATISWKDPARFERIEPSSPMRKATYKVPRAKGDSEDGELGVFQFGAQGGSVDANIDRWVKQFEGVKSTDTKRSQRKVDGMVVHFVEIPSGTYKSGMPGGPTQPKPSYALLGAIVEAPGGSWFFKLTGPKATVSAARKDFTGLIDSIKKTTPG